MAEDNRPSLVTQLNHLMILGIVKEYKIENISEDGEVGIESQMRNTERLTITWADLSIPPLIIDTFCSGCLEDTFLC